MEGWCVKSCACATGAGQMAGPEMHAGGMVQPDAHLCALGLGCWASPGQAFSKALGRQKRVTGKSVPGGGDYGKESWWGDSTSFLGPRFEGRESSECRVQGHPVNFRSALFRMSPLQKRKTPRLLQIKRDNTSAHQINS